MRLAAAVVVAALVGAGAADAAVPRAKGLDPLYPFPYQTTGLLAGDLVVAPGRTHLLGWPVTGGRSQQLGRLPDLGPRSQDDFAGLTLDGFPRVEAAEPGLVAIARRTIQGGATADFDADRGPQLAVGPPEGPFAKVRGCGEVAGTPAALDGGRLAYRARPGGCVERPSIVVRDAAGALVRTVALPAAEQAVNRVQLRGDFLAYAAGADLLDEGEAVLVVVDLRTGARVTVLRGPPRVWTLGDAGVLFARTTDGAEGVCAPAPLRRHAPGDTAGEPIAPACLYGLLDVVDGDVRFTQRASDGRFVLRRSAGETLATTASIVLDGDAEHIVADDADCRSRAARIIDLAGAPVGPAGPRRCPISFSVPRRARLGESLRVQLRCPQGCRASVSNERRRIESLEGPAGQSRSVRVTGRRTVSLPVRGDVIRDGRMRVVIDPLDPVGSRRFVRFVTVR